MTLKKYQKDTIAVIKAFFDALDTKTSQGCLRARHGVCGHDCAPEETAALRTVAFAVWSFGASEFRRES